MRKILVCIAALGLMCSGCAWLGWGDDSESSTVSTAEASENISAMPEAAPLPEETKAEKAAPAKSASKKSASRKKGAKSEAQIKEELDRMGHKLAAQSARTLLPNKAHKEVKKVGNQWVASYVEVDANRVSTEMRPGNAGQYVGFIRYQEHFFECRGDTREAALKAPCTQVRSRNLNELIRYDGKEWQD